MDQEEVFKMQAEGRPLYKFVKFDSHNEWDTKGEDVKGNLLRLRFVDSPMATQVICLSKSETISNSLFKQFWSSWNGGTSGFGTDQWGY